MKFIIQKHIFQIFTLFGLLCALYLTRDIKRTELKSGEEIEYVGSKLDYVESDINFLRHTK